MSREYLKKLIMAALFAALACVATMIIKVPTPGTEGYINLGDAIVILCGVILGPVWGFLAAGIGSCLADLIGGYFVYVPITFVIKGLVALCAGLVYRAIGKTKTTRYAGVILGGVIGYYSGSWRIFCLRIFYLRRWCSCKHSGKYHTGYRWTCNFGYIVSGTYCNSLYS